LTLSGLSFLAVAEAFLNNYLFSNITMIYFIKALLLNLWAILMKIWNFIWNKLENIQNYDYCSIYPDDRYLIFSFKSLGEFEMFDTLCEKTM
jgi:hypothetical protein